MDVKVSSSILRLKFFLRRSDFWVLELDFLPLVENFFDFLLVADFFLDFWIVRSLFW